LYINGERRRSALADGCWAVVSASSRDGFGGRAQASEEREDHDTERRVQDEGRVAGLHGGEEAERGCGEASEGPGQQRGHAVAGERGGVVRGGAGLSQDGLFDAAER
jgi:hypothetical protein